MKFTNKIVRFFRDQEAASAVEYAVMLALIVVVCLTAISAIGTNSNDAFQTVADKLAAKGGGS